MFKKIALIFLFLIAILSLGGCSTGLVDKKLLTIERCNAGEARIYDLRIEGHGLLTTSKEMIGQRLACGSSDSLFVDVPESVNVSWRTPDGVVHKKTVVIKARLDKRFHLQRLIFNFDGDLLQVQQFLSFDEPWVLGRDVTLQVYP